MAFLSFNFLFVCFIIFCGTIIFLRIVGKEKHRREFSLKMWLEDMERTIRDEYIEPDAQNNDDNEVVCTIYPDE